MPGHRAPRLPVKLPKRLLLSLFSFPCFSPPDYHAPLAEATRGELLCDNTRCDPKLTVGTEIVRELPLPSSNETFTGFDDRSEEHTPELQSPCNLVCRLLLEKKKK